MPETRTVPMPYDAPRLVRYGSIEELTRGASHITTNITDLLSIQP